MIRQKYQAQIHKYNIQENSKRVENDYKFGDKFMLNNKSAFKYEAAYNRSFDITHCLTNVIVALQCRTKKLGIIYVLLNHIHLILLLKILLLIHNVMIPHYNIPVI